jgi:medium-chain acyl-[acyl-carrier-protein] hydrolase
MSSPIWIQNYDVNTMVLDHQKRLSLAGLLNMLQDAAWMHAKARGWGFEDLIRKGTIWVLARQKVVMCDWPKWEDNVSIRTWGRDANGVTAVREFAILVGDRKIGECTTTWLVLDWNTRKPQRLDRVDFALICPNEGLLEISAERIPLRNDLQRLATVDVRIGDLDVNGHVNNTRYAQWIIDTMDLDELGRSRITGYEVNFLAETRLGDNIAIEADKAEAAPDGVLRQYQGRLTGGEKPAFAARLTLGPC